MRKILIILLLLPSVAFSGVTVDQLKIVYSKLVIKNNLPHYPLFVHVDHRKVTAFFRKGNLSVNITLAALNTIENEDELAIILGHELTHAMHSDEYGADKVANWDMEIEADQGGAAYAKKAGYNECKGMRWIQRLGKPDEHHPPGKYRYLKICGSK